MGLRWNARAREAQCALVCRLHTAGTSAEARTRLPSPLNCQNLGQRIQHVTAVLGDSIPPPHATIGTQPAHKPGQGTRWFLTGAAATGGGSPGGQWQGTVTHLVSCCASAVTFIWPWHAAARAVNTPVVSTAAAASPATPSLSAIGAKSHGNRARWITCCTVQRCRGCTGAQLRQTDHVQESTANC
jgi:hypothetical protein